MKIFILIFIILMIFLKTGNVLSDSDIFTVNNIKINKNTLKNKEDLINVAFKKGFLKLNEKILLKKDLKKIEKTDLKTIKNLVSHYQIKNDDKDSKENITEINIFFKKDKIYNFFYNNDVKYSDLSGKEIKILPVMIKNGNLMIFENNFFYKNWNKLPENKLNDQNLIDYILPIESIEIIENIKNNRENLENINLSLLFDEHIEKNNIFVLINIQNKNVKFFLKGNISEKQVVKNFKYLNQVGNNNNNFEQLISFLKNQIIEIVKSQNIVDVRTPSFLNVKLIINKNDGLLEAQRIFEKIDLIENFKVNEFNKKYANIKIKYYGKVNKLSEKMKQSGLRLSVENDEWKASLD